ncbi:DMT family transporter [Williamsia sterculiae]|uniref:Permease of the drug/metabolite transporter (DMT) superfamily n=1 Tax=Williamsia sterculiae TaxID=1344003 RepID=A0A1N7GES3_9NOCA|nr:DMT family transporter [Williamsia sterculiae]SIS11059.1 Permease of the drug/metabolite transporter (DMT) superfamily [Williamsia sterculiae]
MRIPLGLAAAIVVLWAFGYPLGALGLTAMSPMLLLTFRFALSAAVVGAIVVARRVALPRGRDLAHVCVAGLLAQAVQFGAVYLGLQMGVPSVIAALVIALNPVATTMLARPLLGVRLTRRSVVAIGLGVLAVVAACAQRLAQVGPLDAGVALTLLGLLGLAVGGVYQQRFCSHIDAMASNAVQLGIATVPTAVMALAIPQSVTDPVRAAWVIPLMVLFSSALCTTLYLRAVTMVGAASASMLFTVIPSVSALLSWVMLGQRPDVGVYAGLALGASALLVARRGAGAARVPVRTTVARRLSVRAERSAPPRPRTPTAAANRADP